MLVHCTTRCYLLLLCLHTQTQPLSAEGCCTASSFPLSPMDEHRYNLNNSSVRSSVYSVRSSMSLGTAQSPFPLLSGGSVNGSGVAWMTPSGGSAAASPYRGHEMAREVSYVVYCCQCSIAVVSIDKAQCYFAVAGLVLQRHTVVARSQCVQL
jgi:hypothetical protein